MSKHESVSYSLFSEYNLYLKVRDRERNKEVKKELTF